MSKMFAQFLRDERGQTMSEYGLILALIAIAAIAVLGALGRGIATKFNEVKASIEGAQPVQP